jgi:hypothetical protein
MNRGKVTTVVRESDGEAHVRLRDGSEHHLATYRPLGVGTKIDLHAIPKNRLEMIALVLDRLPHARRGRLHTGFTLEHRGVVMVLDDEYIVIQRRGPNEQGAAFDYSHEGVQRGLKKFFDELNR